MELLEKIEDLILKDSSDFEVSKAFRDAIKEHLNSLGDIFEKNQGKDFLVKHTKAIDNFITLIYKYSLRVNFADYTPMSNAIPITLVALGSYAREQLCVYSDIDLMIVYKDIKGFNTKEIIEKILYTIWDTNLKLGHRVHEVSELEEVVKSDITIKTAILESRFLCGSKFLWFEIENKLKNIRKYKQKEFVIEKIQELEKRRAKYPISMEPFIKDGDGGLRDANTVFWIANAIYGVDMIKNLTDSLLDSNDYRDFRVALEFLFRIRSALHLLNRKKQDRLMLESIVDVARMLGFKDTKSIKAERQLVSKTLSSIHTVSFISDLFIDVATRKVLFNRENIAKLKNARFSKGVFILDNKVITSLKITNLNQILKIILLLPDTNLKFDISFIKLLRDSTKIKNKMTKELMKGIFSKENSSEIFSTFLKANIIDFLIPPLKQVRFLAQFDGYHKYPVDIHSIYTLNRLENIQDEFIKSIYQSLPKDKKLILKIVALLHDCGKGRASDHSIVGEKLFKTYAKKLFFSDALVEIGSILIKYHTLMTKVAYHEDIYNEVVIYSFVSRLKDKSILDLLYILTYADVNAVNDKYYSNFDSNLLRELYLNSIVALEKDEVILESERRVKKEETLKKSDMFLSIPKSLQRKILNIESNQFFFKNRIDDIIGISKSAYNMDSRVKSVSNEQNLIIEIIRDTPPLNLSYLLGKLSNLDLANMDISKLFDNKKYFKIEFYEKVEEFELEYINQLIDDSFDMTKKLKLKKPEILKKEIKIDFDYSKNLAKMNINAKNQKGLVAYVIRTFDEYEISITTAKIHTIKNRARDMFLIEKSENLIKYKDEILAKLVE